MIADAPSGAALFPTSEKTIFDEIRQIGSGDYQYYRHADGTLDFGQIGKKRCYESAHLLEGWEPLGGPTARAAARADYGVFDLHEYYLENPFEVLFMRGGAVEMPVKQIVELGYHLRPPRIPRCGLQVGAEHKRASGTMLHLPICWRGARTVEFPQLAGKTHADPGECPFCERDDFPHAKSRNQHVRVLHRDEMREMSLADAIVRGVQAAQAGAAPQTVATPTADEAALRAQAAAEKAEMDEKLKAMGMLDAEEDEEEGISDADLLAMSQGDDDEASLPDAKEKPIRLPRRKKAATND